VNTGEPATALAPGQTEAGAQSTYLICQAQMGAVAAGNFYSGDQGTTPFAAAGFANAWLQQVGNRNLKSEKADTWSAGFVFAGSGISDNAWLRGFTGSVDWWKVNIKDAIQPYSADYAGWLCYGQVTVTTPAEAEAYVTGPGKESCDKVPREPTRGTALSKRVAFDNQATIETSGIDVALNWSTQLQEIGLGAPGRFGINTQATFLDYYRTKASPISIDIPVDWKGSLGPNLVGTNPGAYSYRINTNLNYSVNRASMNLGWRHLPSVWTAAKAYENAVVANNAQVAAGGSGTLLGYTKSAEIKTGSYNEFSLAGTFEVNDTLSLRAGIDNLFDVKPRLIGGVHEVTAAQTQVPAAAPGDPPNTAFNTPTNRCYQLPGCSPGAPALARSSLAASAGQFTGTKGYYDVMGRSFFLGFKASF
jgi:outer membrane receptor protein involved in Fe transport